MKIQLTDFCKYKIFGESELPIKIKACWFDTSAWIMRYVQVERESKNYLLPTSIFGSYSEHSQSISVLGTPGWIEKLIPFTGSSISREFEIEILRSLGLPSYWEGDEEVTHRNFTSMIQKSETSVQEDGVDIRDIDYVHLVSSAQFMNANVIGDNGAIGELTNIVFRIESWDLSCFLVDTADGHGRLLLIDPEWIDRWTPSKKEIHIDMTKEIILLEAIFDPRKEGDQKYEFDV